MLNLIKEKVRKTKAYGRVGAYLFARRARAFDKKHNVETAREVRFHELEIDSPNVAHGVFYAGTDPKSFRPILDQLKIRFEDFVFVDFGSGKGRALLMASERPFKKITGVEFALELDAVARKNIASYTNSNQKCRNIESICQDATLFAPPIEPTVFYIFNSFHAQILSIVLTNIEKSIAENPREIYIIYACPMHNEVLQASNFFDEIYSDTWYSVYKNIAPAN